MTSRTPHAGLAKQMVYVSGLPRAGSTLICQLLGIHPRIYSIGHSSPLANLLEQLRHGLSDSYYRYKYRHATHPKISPPAAMP